MSGVYIFGTEMPKEHPLYITLRPDGSVHVWDSYSGESYGTQVISVPDHDDLIDRTTVKDYWLYADWNTCMDLGKEKNAFAVINSVPAIISADKEVDNG